MKDKSDRGRPHVLKDCECRYCSKTFPRKSNLKKHMKKHLDIRPFRCSVCVKRFKYKKSLVHHEKLHTREKKFQCEFCTRSFNNIANFNRHKAVHESGASFFYCDTCQRKFTDKHKHELHRKSYLIEARDRNKHVKKEETPAGPSSAQVVFNFHNYCLSPTQTPNKIKRKSKTSKTGSLEKKVKQVKSSSAHIQEEVMIEAGQSSAHVQEEATIEAGQFSAHVQEEVTIEAGQSSAHVQEGDDRSRLMFRKK
ncbi:zinc finger protein 729-like [Centruroides sculpturatus]|uniref:zinc finger protein 729-like n=1 Tax=Centruroides sculpturatus TaxID=218467 RepID=UPI000C6D6CF4|nr:zinc finger protein 729-like [Centruroides sculpturatus]